jgi:uncharacterized protein YeaO (DUF488 family)
VQIWTRRIYDPPTAQDGTRILVDRVWPRGVSKENARLDAWFREAAPSTELRKWFGHDPERWEGFKQRYHRELEEHQGALAPLLEAARAGRVTLVFGARDADHNNAVALREYLLQHADRRP